MNETKVVDAPRSAPPIEASGIATPSTAPASPDPACGECLGSTVAWGWVGGLPSYDDASSITACRMYTHRRHWRVPPAGGDSSCTIELAACGAHGGIPLADVAAVLADADVQAALAAAPIVYGIDDRVGDGAVFELTIGSKVIDVGRPCNGFMDCVLIPRGVERAVRFLRHVDEAQLATEACAGKF